MVLPETRTGVDSPATARTIAVGGSAGIGEITYIFVSRRTS
jgi:hypothetical protein